MSRRSRLVVAAAGGIVLTTSWVSVGWGGTGGTPAPPVAPGPCHPTGARTVAANASVRVFSLRGTVYGCSRRTGNRYRLGMLSYCQLSARVGPVVVAGDEAAYGLERCGVDTGWTEVVVRRLTDGRQLRSEASIAGGLGPESFQSVDSLVLKPDGAVAWIATGASIVNVGSKLVELHRIDSRGAALLDSGPALSPGSLRLQGSRLTWRHGSGARSSSLS